jgi:translation initiation factor 3 subunit E
MSEADAEKWLIELITQAQLDAKIDSTERQVVMAVPRPSVYQQVIEKTRDLTVRTRVLADNIDAAVTEGGAGAGGFGRYRGGGERH